MLVADSYLVDGCSKPNAVAMVRVPQYSTEKGNGETRYIQAIISLTRYTYRDMIIRDSRRIHTMDVSRILGHCGRKDAQYYLDLLSHWIQKDSLEEPVTLPESSQKSGGNSEFSRRLFVVFRLSFSHAFNVQLSSAKDKESLDFDKDVNEQR